MVRMGQVWDRTVEFLGDRLGVLLPVAIGGIFVPTSVLNAFGAVWATAGPGTRGVLTIVTLLLYLAIFWAYLTITAIALDPAARTLHWGAAGRRLPAGVGAYLLLLLGVVVLSMPIGILAVLSGIDVAALGAGVATAPTSRGLLWATMLYALAFGIAILAVGARLLPLTGVVYAERRGAGAIARCWRLTRGLTWRLVGVLVLYIVVLQVAALAAQTVFGSILRLFAGRPGSLDVATIVTGIVVAGVQTGFSLLGAAFAAKLYEATVRREGVAATATATVTSA